MALIGKIRKNSWLLIVLIGLGLGGFIVMDMFSGQQSLFGSGATTVAEINGEKVDINEFNRIENTLYGGSADYGGRNYIYNYMIEESLVNSEAEAIGLGVSDVEMNDLLWGANRSPIVTQFFTVNGQFNNEFYQQYKTWADENETPMPEQVLPRWNYLKEQVTKDRLQTKMLTMVEKGLYTPTWMAQEYGVDNNTRRDIALVQVPFDVIDNTDVALTDADYETYLKNNMAKFVSDEEIRTVQYLVFDVQPTKEDSVAIRNAVTKMGTDFAAETQDDIFIDANYGTASQQWQTADQLPAPVKDTLARMAKGQVYGPYLDGNAYRVAKILDKQVIPDSAKCRHILVGVPQPAQRGGQPVATPADFARAQKTADSLKLVLDQGASWDSIALKHSEDPGSKNKGGFYDWAANNAYVPAFNDVVFFSGEMGQTYTVETNFGVHIIEPLGRKGDRKTYVKAGYVGQNIIPSEETQRAIENEVIDIVDNTRTLDGLKKIAAEKGMEMTTSQQLKANDYSLGTLGQGNVPRDIIRWAFGNDRQLGAVSVGDVSPNHYVFQDPVDFYTSKVVAVALNNIQAPGNPSVKDVKALIEPLVINQKKGEQIKAAISGKSSLSAIASAYEEVSVDTVRSVTFAAFSVPNLGAEPNVQGATFTTAMNSMSAPVIGTNGVFVVMPIAETPAANTMPVAQNQKAASSAISSQVRSRLLQALRKNADIEDSRAKWF